MSDPRRTYVANISIMFTEVPLLERAAAAKQAGFDDVEMWWPFPDPVASRPKVDELLESLASAEVNLRGLNFFAGDMPGGERGVASHPDRRTDLEANTEQVLDIARTTGCRHFNLLYGQRDPRWSPEEQDATALSAIVRAADAVEPIGGTILLEPLAEGLNGAYPLITPTQVVDLLNGPLSEHRNVMLLFDLFHLGSNGFDIVDGVEALMPYIGHVQIADAPGRGEPGSGQLPITASLQRLLDMGYQGLIAAEYKPTQQTEHTLGWMGLAE